MTMRNRILRAMSIEPMWDRARGRPREKYAFEYISRDGRTIIYIQFAHRCTAYVGLAQAHPNLWGWARWESSIDTFVVYPAPWAELGVKFWSSTVY